ncbi:Glycerate kinase [Geodia barretti]|uniref:Glycerate kinase n=1 Tax=Geodia barretti TaxID=519541 RepID=A0AA35T0Q7_GEOBA|nr:Glycerate kinase [Geodia barretti]
MALRIVVSPQAFKHSIGAREAALAIQRGILQAAPDAETILIPVADGGDGTLAALIDTTGGSYREATVTGPLGEPLAARWGVMGDGETAVIEMALASGLALIPDDRRDPLRATTRGTGELMLAALDDGYRRIIVGLGGSATNDGGAGMASALGARFLDSQDGQLPAGGAALENLTNVDALALHPALSETTIVGATDVTNPLCGDTGASAIFGPQKGATPEMVSQLDRCLANLASVIRSDLGVDVLNTPGSGAAGGLGAGLIAFAGAELRSGIDMVCDVLDFDRNVRGADLVITGEGRADRSTAFDKAPVGIARRARQFGVPTVLVAGSLGPGYETLYQHGIDAIVPIAEEPADLASSLRRGSELLERAAERAVRLYTLGRAG